MKSELYIKAWRSEWVHGHTFSDTGLIPRHFYENLNHPRLAEERGDMILKVSIYAFAGNNKRLSMVNEGIWINNSPLLMAHLEIVNNPKSVS